MMHDAQLTPRDWTIAALLAAVMYALFLNQSGAAVLAGRLPDTDDLMRLAQVRDWLGGQRFGDLAQHRLGAAGWSMHWSRIGDLGIAAWIVVLRPAIGMAQAEIAATMLWPATLFLLYLAASARLAIRLGGRDAAMPALVVAAFAFPAISMFLPGRIDHHGLQIVLVLIAADAVIGPPSARSGAIAGLAVAASLAIGLETAPQMLVAMAAFFPTWVMGGMRERARLAAFALATGTATTGWLALARPDIWPRDACDAFTPASVVATLAAAGAMLVLAGATPWLGSVRHRLFAGTGIGGLALVVMFPSFAPCLGGPYAQVDPLLQRLWLAHVEEARGLFAHRPDVMIAFGALPIVATLTCGWLAATRRTPGWAIVLAFQLAGLAVMLIQVRGAALAAALAAPALAQLILAARARGSAALLIGAWLLSAGALWKAAGAMLAAPALAASQAAGPGCTDPAMLGRLARLAPGTVIAPIDAGPAILAATPHRVLAAPYHRNNAGNRAAYDFWLSPPDRARGIARAWHADYVLACPDAFGGIDLAREGPGGMAMVLASVRVPEWLRPVTPAGGSVRIFRIVR